MSRIDRRRRFHRQHGAMQSGDRTELESAGWRTTLDYRENHVRARDGQLTHLQVVWRAAAERDEPDDPDGPRVVEATASTQDRVWSRLRTKAEVADVSARRARVRGRADAV